jgi:hypothetical protein
MPFELFLSPGLRNCSVVLILPWQTQFQFVPIWNTVQHVSLQNNIWFSAVWRSYNRRWPEAKHLWHFHSQGRSVSSHIFIHPFICILPSSLLYFATFKAKAGSELLFFLTVLSGITVDGRNGDVAVDQYHHYKVLLSANLRTINVTRTTYMQWLLVSHPQALCACPTPLLLFSY